MLEKKFSEGQNIQAVGKIRLVSILISYGMNCLYFIQFNNRISLIAFHIREVSLEAIEVFKMESKLAKIYFIKVRWQAYVYLTIVFHRIFLNKPVDWRRPSSKQLKMGRHVKDKDLPQYWTLALRIQTRQVVWAWMFVLHQFQHQIAKLSKMCQAQPRMLLINRLIWHNSKWRF